MGRKTMFGKMLALLVAGMIGFAGFSLLAADQKNAPARDRDAESAVDPMGGKLLRGIVNMGTGWGEVIRQPVRAFQNDNPYLAFPFGLFRGIVMTVVRTGSGIVETAFCYVPFDGTYDSLLDPAYVWQKEAGAAEGVKEE